MSAPSLDPNSIYEEITSEIIANTNDSISTSGVDPVEEAKIDELKKEIEQYEINYQTFVKTLLPTVTNFPPDMLQTLLNKLSSINATLDSNTPQALATIPGFSSALETTVTAFDQMIKNMIAIQNAKKVLDYSQQPLVADIRNHKLHGDIKAFSDDLDNLLTVAATGSIGS